jgi:hypothetical protein
MKRLGFILMMLMLAGCGGGGNGAGGEQTDADADSGLRMGILQFRVQHTLRDDSCLPDQCSLSMEEEADTAAWLDPIAARSNMAVLHWDRAIPWLAFDENPPPGVSRMDFYDGRIDGRLHAWIDAFAAHFSRMPSGYLAVRLLNGRRNGLQPCRVNETLNVEVAGACPVLSPGTQIQFTYDPGSGPVSASFDLERSYTNFVMYLYDKLQPDYLALMVEVNLFKEMAAPCPANWDGLARLYRNIYDSVRPQVDSRTKVFATVTLQQLLGYDAEVCHGPLVFEACTGDPAPPAFAAPVPDICYPLDLSAVYDLDQGNRLEILALSIYPDALMMDVADDDLMRVYPGDGDGTGNCLLRAPVYPYLDPTAALDRFNWTKPMAIAELGARSNPTMIYSGGYLARPPADLTSQAFWLKLFLTAARERDFEFYVQSFSDDYEAIGPWTVRDGILDADTYSLFNNFAYMGLYDAQGAPKAGVTDTWMDTLLE